MPSFFDQLAREARIRQKTRSTLLGIDHPDRSGLAQRHVGATAEAPNLSVPAPQTPPAPQNAPNQAPSGAQTPSAPAHTPVPAPNTSFSGRTALTQADVERDFYQKFGRYPTALDMKLLRARQKLRQRGVNITPEQILGEAVQSRGVPDLFKEEEEPV